MPKMLHGCNKRGGEHSDEMDYSYLVEFRPEDVEGIE